MTFPERGIVYGTGHGASSTTTNYKGPVRSPLGLLYVKNDVVPPWLAFYLKSPLFCTFTLLAHNLVCPYNVLRNGSNG